MTRIEDSNHLLTVGGIETYLLFIQQFPLREFCAFEVFEDDRALAKLEAAFLAPIAEAAAANGHDLLLDVLGWRAQPDFIGALGYDERDVERLNRLAVERSRELARRVRRGDATVFLNGDIGPRGDGYRIARELTVDGARRYHSRQIDALAECGIDVINALTMTNVSEAIGIARAARDAGLPCIISPTIETDGNTPEGKPLGRFIHEVEDATQGSPLFYMVNCAHPTHIEPTLLHARDRGEPWLERFQGFRANASQKSHAELDESTELDRGNPEALAVHMARLRASFGLRLVGGCCGTDAEHIRGIAERTNAASPRGLIRSVG